MAGAHRTAIQGKQHKQRVAALRIKMRGVQDAAADPESMTINQAPLVPHPDPLGELRPELVAHGGRFLAVQLGHRFFQCMASNRTGIGTRQ